MRAAKDGHFTSTGRDFEEHNSVALSGRATNHGALGEQRKQTDDGPIANRRIASPGWLGLLTFCSLRWQRKMEPLWSPAVATAGKGGLGKSPARRGFCVQVTLLVVDRVIKWAYCGRPLGR
jgi:hypothetical protein